MRAFWFWFLLMAGAWAGYFLQAPSENEIPARLALAGAFFAAYFLTPVLRERPAVLTASFAAAALLAAAAMWPSASGAEPGAGGTGLYPLLVFTLLAGDAVFRLPARHAAIAGAFAAAGLLAPAAAGVPGSLPLPFAALYIAAFAAASAHYAAAVGRQEELAARNEALLSEYRRLKRSHATDEAAARREARIQAGRDIHDSVGHRLTALLMQLEMHRLKAEGEDRDVFEGLKKLAKESLEETRNAVKTLGRDDEAGLPAILGLIRKLESESFMRIQFTVKDGALSAPLDNAQSVAVYRAVQEALTNAMRHGSERAAEVMFESPGGGSVFRFEVVNRYRGGDAGLAEGFGLRSMRERMRSAGGELETSADGGRFIVRGTFLLKRKGAET